MGVDGINVMARNFVSSDSQESKYSKARQVAAEARGQMANRQNSLLAAGMAACAAADPDGGHMSRRVLEGQKAARRMQLDKQQNVAEKSRDNLDELKKRLEEKAKEARQHTDEQGNAEDGRETPLDVETGSVGSAAAVASPSATSLAAAGHAAVPTVSTENSAVINAAAPTGNAIPAASHVPGELNLAV